MKNAIRRGSAILAALVLVVSTVLGQAPLESRAETDTSASVYTEYTFSDFGLQEGTYTSAAGATATGFTSLDKVAVSGKLAIGAQGVYLRIGGTTSGYVSIVSFRSDSAGTKLLAEDFVNSGTGAEVCAMTLGKEIDIRITFDYVNNGADVLVKFYVDGTYAAEYTSVGTAATVQPTIQISDASAEKTITIKDKTETPASVYAEYTFSDFGLQEGTYTSAAGGTSTKIATLDKVAVSGKLAIGAVGVALRIGGIKSGETVNRFTSIVSFRSNGAGTKLLAEDVYNAGAKIGAEVCAMTLGEEIDIRITFDYVGADVLVKFYVGGKLAAEYTSVGTAATVQPTIQIADASASKSVTIRDNKEITKEYIELTFSDFGLENGKYTTSEGGKVDIAGLDRVAVSGTISMPAAGAKLRIGGTTDAYHGIVSFRSNSAGSELLVQDINGGTEKKVCDMTADTPMDIRITFDYVDEYVLAKIYVDGVYMLPYTSTAKAADVKAWLQIADATEANYIEIESVKKYTELTFSDFGLKDGKYTSAQGGTAGIETLDKVAVSGKLVIGASQVFLRIGGTTDPYHGIVSFRSSSDGTKLLAEDFVNSGTGATVCTMTLGEKKDVRITFDYVNEGADVRVGFYIDGEKAAEYTSVGTAASVQPTIQIADANEEKYIEIESVKKYTELTFSDFGLNDGKYTSPQGGTADIETLDKVAISGKFAIGAADMALRIGGVESSYKGIVSFRSNNDGTKLLAEDVYNASANIGAEVCPMTLGEKKDVRITFDYVNEGADVQVGFYINGEKAAEYTSVGTAARVQPTIQIADATEAKYIEIESSQIERNTYRTLDFSDWEIEGIENGSYKEGRGYGLRDKSITSLDGCVFESVVNFGGATNGSTYIRIGGTSQKPTVGVSLFASGTTQFKVTNFINIDDGFNKNATTLYTPAGWSNSGDMKLRMTFDEIMKDTWVVGIWINDVHQGNRYLRNTALDTYLYFQGQGMSLGYIDQSSIIANVDSTSNNSYLVTEEGTKIDGMTYSKGISYKNVGVHTLSYTKYGQSVERKLIMYKQGDATADGKINIYDLVRIKRYTGGGAANEAQKLGADWDSNGFLNSTDEVQLRKKLLAGEADGLHFGIGETNYSLGSTTPTYATNAFIADALGAFGVDSHRIWLPLMADARSQGDGTYKVTLRQTEVEKVRDLVTRLRAQGVDRIVVYPVMYVMMSDYRVYISDTGQSYSAEELEASNSAGKPVKIVYHDNLAIPDPVEEPTQYQNFMNIQKEYYRLLATEFPEITYFETINEPEGGGSVHPFGSRYTGTGWTQTAGYDADTIAKICMDFSYAATAGVRKAGTGGKVLCPALTGTGNGKTFLQKFYDYINNPNNTHRDTVIDHYFQILNWHPYIFYTPTDGGVVYNGSNWDAATVFRDWAAWQKEMYQIAVNAGDGNTPVWYTELGVTDVGELENFNFIGSPITQDKTASRYEKMLTTIKNELSFVDTVMTFRLNDQAKDTGTSYPKDYEANFGMFELFDNATSGAACLKPIAKAFYRVANGGSTDYSALTSMLDRHYASYKRAAVVEDFSSFGVLSGGKKFKSYNSGITLTAGSGDTRLQPTLSKVETGDGGYALALDYGKQQITSNANDIFANICFDLGKLEAGTYTITYDISDVAMSADGKLNHVYVGVTGSTNPNSWSSDKIASTLKDNTSNTGVQLIKQDGTYKDEKVGKITFTLSAAKNDVCLYFQMMGNVAQTGTTYSSVGSYRVIFDNITLTKTK